MRCRSNDDGRALKVRLKVALCLELLSSTRLIVLIDDLDLMLTNQSSDLDKSMIESAPILSRELKKSHNLTVLESVNGGCSLDSWSLDSVI